LIPTTVQKPWHCGKDCIKPISMGIQNLVIVGDSRLVIRAIIHRTQTQSAKLNNLLDKIHLLLGCFSSYEIYHVLRELNEKADVEANKGALLAPGNLNLNGTMSTVELS
jgi:ribonuclease HI